jgi:hypothetical protein
VSAAQEAQQLTGVGMMVPLMLASFLLVAADRRYRRGRPLAR